MARLGYGVHMNAEETRLWISPGVPVFDTKAGGKVVRLDSPHLFDQEAEERRRSGPGGRGRAYATPPAPLRESKGDKMNNALAVIDVPNMDMCLTDLLGRKPERADRPNWGRMHFWLQDLANPGSLEACAFTNVSAPPCAAQRGWLHYLRKEGFAVFAKPRTEGSDVDEEMLEHLRARHAEGSLSHVAVFSHDAENFLEPLTALARAAPAPLVTVVGFRELAGDLADSEELNYVDIGDLPGVFSTELPRTTLDDLPAEGGWLQPIQPAVC